MHDKLVSIIYWQKMKDGSRQVVKEWPTPQRFKKKKKIYGKLPPKNVELIPCDTVCVDLIGPYTVNDQKGNDRNLNAMTFVCEGIMLIW